MLVLFFMVLGSCADPRSAADAAMRVQDWTRAIRLHESLLDQYPDNADLRKALGIAQFSLAELRESQGEQDLESYERAAEEFRILLIHAPHDTTARMLRSECLSKSGRAALVDGRVAAALTLLDLSLQLDSANWNAWILKGIALEKAELETHAIDAFQRVISREPNNGNAYLHLGMLHWRRSRFGDAWDAWTLGLERDSTNATLVYWAQQAETKLQEQALLEPSLPLDNK